MTVRALFHAMAVPGATAPYDRAILKVHYPARFTGAPEERLMGTVAADASRGLMPVVVFFNGANCPPDGYSWLAIALAERGYIVVTFSYVAEDLPGFPGLSTGIVLSKVMPANFGTGPTSRLVKPLLEALVNLNRMEKGVLNGLVDTHKVILAGHSAGGTLALHNARRDWFPSVVGAFAYGAHTVPAAMLGYPSGTVLPAGHGLPILLLEAQHDGVIAGSTARYDDASAEAPIFQTFQNGGCAPGSLMAVVMGANHFSIVNPPDPTTGRAFLDSKEEVPGDLLRTVLVEIIGTYCDSVAQGDTAAQEQLNEWTTEGHPWLADIVRK
jgi:dienelactone hydrolase